VLEVLREPLESGRITISRAARQADFPARFQLVAAMNPCPCGFAGDPSGKCRCNEMQVARYRRRISGPLLDRIDLHVCVSRVSFDDLVGEAPAESSATIRARVDSARDRQRTRFAHSAIATNAAIPAAEVRRHCPLEADALALLEGAVTRGALSARAFDRIARVARTIADLAASEAIRREHVAEALIYRGFDRTARAA
jgi:magnesium chelatase family protein